MNNSNAPKVSINGTPVKMVRVREQSTASAGVLGVAALALVVGSIVATIWGADWRFIPTAVALGFVLLVVEHAATVARRKRRTK